MLNNEICRLGNVSRTLNDIQKELDHFKELLSDKNKRIKLLEDRAYDLERKLNKERNRVKVMFLIMVGVLTFFMNHSGG